MKKLAYIILVIAILLIIAHFVKTDTNAVADMSQPTDAATAVIEEETAAAPASNEEASETAQASESAEVAQPTNAPAEGSDVVEVQETSEDIIVGDEPEDDGAIDVVETSEATMDEEETVLPE